MAIKIHNAFLPMVLFNNLVLVGMGCAVCGVRWPIRAHALQLKGPFYDVSTLKLLLV